MSSLLIICLLLHISAALPKRSAPPDGRVGQLVALDGVSFSEGELLLKVPKQNVDHMHARVRILSACTHVIVSS